MTGLFDALALLITAAALTAGALVLTRTRRLGPALPVLLDLLTAAGLLRLAGEPNYRRVAAAAAVLVVRRLAGLGLRQRVRTAPPQPAAVMAGRRGRRTRRRELRAR